MSDSGVSLLPTAGIKDPQVRAWAEAFASTWDLRNGNTKDQGRRFITQAELEGLTQDAVAKTLAGAIGGSGTAVGGAGTSPGAKAIVDAIGGLADSIRKSILFEILGTPIPLIDIDQLRKRGDAGIQAESEVRKGKDMAIASAVNTIWAAIGSTSAVIQDGELASATPSTAIAQKWTQVQAAVTDPNTGQVSSTSIKQDLQSYASTTNGILRSTYSVRAQVSVGGRTLIGGFGLAATSGGGAGPTIDFGVRVDRFFIGATSETPDAATQISQGSEIPFMVLTRNETITVNGKQVVYGPGVYIKQATIGTAAIGTAEIADGTITTAKIVDATITTAKIIDGTITEAKIANATVSNQKMTGPIYSDNYFPSGGTAGWCIQRDGYAVFNNVRVRGDIQANSLTANSVYAGNINFGAVGTDKIATGSVVVQGGSNGMYSTSVSFYIDVPCGVQVVACYNVQIEPEDGRSFATLYRDGQAVQTRGGRSQVIIVQSDYLGPGNHTYTIQGAGTGDCTLNLIAGKR